MPFDGNLIKTKMATGSPTTNYINASVIRFNNLEQTFIAAQAPKPNSFMNFWQMVLENEINVIVMITGLTEGNIKKADQYWPDEENRTINLEGNIQLKYIDTSYQGTYYLRTIDVSTGQKVNQLQITKWMDLTAPDDTRILLDLVNKVRELVGSKKGPPILVHCSAGVGRTGTFICLYKLMSDYFSPKVEQLDPFKTVLEMRTQRMKMVQKPSQYVYIFRCVKDMVRTEEVVYYDNV